ncbi:MAG: radical SAM protein [Bacteroidota bacterium]
MASCVVSEIFHSIQGESTHAGRPCVFVRLAFCNLRCTWCDTAYAFEGGETLAVEAILARVAAFGCRLVEVTGGEPLAQESAPVLLRELCDAGYEVLLETGGSCDIGGVDPRVKRIVDFKCPGSGMDGRNLWANARTLGPGDEVKFVIAGREDFDWAAAKVREHALDRRCPVLFSPVSGMLPPADLARWILEGGLPVRLQLQMHKHIWEPAMRGV